MELTGHAESLAVLSRWRFDPMALASCRDFRLRREANADAGTLLKTGHWSPYCWEEKSQRVALVQCPADVDLAVAPFYYLAQFQYAQRLLLLNHNDFIALAEERKQPFTPILIHSTGRAGTTLLSKMFGRLPSCVSISEPDFYTSWLAVGPACRAGPHTASDILRAATQLYFQPQPHQPATHLVLKFRGMCIELAADLRAALPDAIDLFLYRDAERYVASSLGAFGYFPSPLWFIRWLHRLYITRPILTAALSHQFELLRRMFPLVADYTPRELCRLGPIGQITLSWLSMMHKALEVTSSGRALPSLRYEELKHAPVNTLATVFRYCRLDDRNVGLAQEALTADSQAGSVVARSRRTTYELTPKDRQIIHSVLSRHPVINRPDYELPNPIGTVGDDAPRTKPTAIDLANRQSDVGTHG